MSRLELGILFVMFWVWWMAVSGLLIYLYEKSKAKKKVKTVQPQPQIEVYGKNYKKINTSRNVLDKTV